MIDKSPISDECEKTMRRLIRERRKLGENWRIGRYPRPKGGGMYLPNPESMHLVIHETPTSRDIACFYYSQWPGATIAISTVGPADSTGFPGLLPRLSTETSVYFRDLDVVGSFNTIYALALKMWKVGAKARAVQNRLKAV